MRNRPLFGTTFIILIAIVAAAITPLTIFNIQGFKDFFYTETESRLIESCTMLKNLFPPCSPKDTGQIQLYTKKAADSTNLRLTITSADGLVLSDSHNNPVQMNNHIDRPEIKSAMSNGFGTATRNSATMAHEMMYAAVKIRFSDGSSGSIRLARSLEEIESSIDKITASTLLICIIALLLAAWISFMIAGRVSMIIRELKVTTGHYASGNFSEQLTIAKPSEIAELAKHLNSMGRQLEERISTIEEQKNELQLILDSMAEPVLFTDHDMHLLRINGAAEKLFKLDGRRDRGKSIIELFMSMDFNSFAKELVNTGSSLQRIISIDIPNTIQLDTHGSVLVDNTGKNTIALLFVMRDITRTKQLEQIRKDFVANVSHELKTPVTMIKGYAETLLDTSERNPKKTTDFLRIIEKHSLRVEAIINDLLFLSGLEQNDSEAMQLETIPAIDLITSAISGCILKADEKNINIEVDCSEDTAITVYPLLAEQALINLIDNAIKYSGNNTTVEIRAEKSGSGKCCLCVKDYGCGIAEDQQNRIFERFYRIDKARSRDSGGTGLGLSIVKHIALTHGGTVELKSTPADGSSFTLCI